MPGSLHVEEFGAGAAVVLVHSSGLSGRQWQRLVPGIVERGLRAVVPDLTGHGANPAWVEPRPFSFRDDVAHVAALVREQGPAHLVGHSYGGLVALHAALAAPESVRSLSLYDPVAFGLLDPIADADACAELSSANREWGPEASDRERWLEAFVDYWGGRGAWAALREEARAEFRRVGWVCREGVRTLLEDTTPAMAYRVVVAPALLLTGERSPLAARTVALRLGEVLPNARTHTVPKAGHMGPLTHAEAVNGAILDAIAPPAGARGTW